MDEVTFYRATIRAYRHTFAEILDLVDGSSSFAAQSVMEVLREAQKRLDKLAAMAPESLLDPSTLREKRGLGSIEEWR